MLTKTTQFKIRKNKTKIRERDLKDKRKTEKQKNRKD